VIIVHRLIAHRIMTPINCCVCIVRYDGVSILIAVASDLITAVRVVCIVFEPDPNHSSDAGTKIAFYDIVYALLRGILRRKKKARHTVSGGFKMVLFTAPLEHFCRRKMCFTECPSSFCHRDAMQFCLLNELAVF